MNSFVPKNRGKLVIIDARASREIQAGLEALGLDIIRTLACKDVDPSIAYHPDIVIHPLGEGCLVVAPNVYEYYKEKLSPYGFKLIRGSKYLGLKYPEDIAYNVARIGNLAIHRLDSTDPKLSELLGQSGIELINTRQGYSKCSLAAVGKEAAITSDRIIYEKLIDQGYKVLLVEPGHIRLEGQNYGFIGGAMGNLSPSEILLSGRLDGHPDKEKIEEFSRQNGQELIYLSKEPIWDLGTIMVLEI